MTREWQPGDMALIEAGCWADRKIGLRLAEGWSHVNGVNVDGDGIVSPVRRLFVIDLAPEMDDIGGGVVAGWLREAAKADGRRGIIAGFGHIARQIEEQCRAIAEPTDPKTRVTDRRENVWRLLADGDWVCTSGPDIGEYLVWWQLVDRGPLEVQS